MNQKSEKKTTNNVERDFYKLLKNSNFRNIAEVTLIT